MAKSLDDLIQYLLEEIALSGNQGVTINDIATFTSAFYGDSKNGSFPDKTAAGVAVDSRFLAKIWTWLGRHPDVSIGEDRKYNGTPLAEVEHQFPGYLDCNKGHSQAANEATPDLDDSQRPPSSSNPPPDPHHSEGENGPRIRLDDARVYQAICGHPPDPSKVSPLEFDLLSIIAAERSNGILQGNLRQASGQDKRSVPKRTDALQKKGYIVKEIVYRKGVKTSRLILKKFASSSGADVEPTPRGSTVRDVVRRIFDVLSQQDFIPQNKLAEDLSFESAVESAALVKILRRLERLNCVKRVRTATGPSATASDLQQFVQLLRPPSPEDLDGFDTEDFSLDQPLQDLLSAIGSEEHDDAIVGFSTMDEPQEAQSEATRHVARWNPDRIMSNVVVDAVQLMGMTGLTNWDARRMITGLFVRRTMESFLNRISSRSLVIQPPHLRHLAVVRVPIIVDGVAQYVHYSWDVFRQLAEKKEVDISQIPGAEEALRSSVQTTYDTSVTSVANTDAFGFPLQAAPGQQYRNGEAHFEDLIRTVAAVDVLPRPGEPIIVEKDGVSSLGLRGGTRAPAKVRKKAAPKPAVPKPAVPKRRSRPKSEDITLGRPRKYLKGTERFWRMQFHLARLEAGGPLAMSKKGLMQDPAGLALYERRPAGFDETLLQAIEAGLPIPAQPTDINDTWVASTKHILSRRSDGIYVTSQGARPSYLRHRSQIVIIKTARLQQVDFNDRAKVHPFRFISSMAAHSFAYRKYYPSLHVTKQLSQRPMRVVLDKNSSSQDPEKRKGRPQHGAVHGDPDLGLPAMPSPQKLDSGPVAVNTPMEIADEERKWNDQPIPHAMNVAKDAMSSVGPGFTIEASMLSDKEDLQPFNDKPDSPAAESPGSKSIHTSSPAKAITERLVSSSSPNTAQPHQSMHGHSGEELSEPHLSPVDEAVELDEQGVTDATSSLDRTQQQPLSTFSVGEVKSSSLPVLVAVSDVNHPQPVDKHALTMDESNIPMTGHSQAANPEEDQTGRYRTPPGPVDPEQFSVPTAKELPGPEETPQPEQLATARGGSAAPSASVGPSRQAFKKRVSRAKAQLQADVDIPQSSDSEAVGTPRKQQTEGRGRYTPGTNALCRKIVLELVSEASGVVPNDPSTLKRISAARWQEAGAEGRPLLKAVKGAIKALCESGKLKQVMFSFRGKSGIMVKRAVLFLPKISPFSETVEEVKQKMIDAEPADYIPPEWTAEGSRAPLVGKNAPRTLLVYESTPPPTRRRVSSVAAEVVANTPASRSTRSATRSSPREPSRSPCPPPRVCAATGFLTLKVPSLGSLPAVQMFNWRTAAPVKALNLDITAPNAPQARPAVASTRGRGGRKPVNRQAGRSIVWAKQQGRDFPSSLEDILQLPDLKIKYEDVQSDDSDWQRFACEIEGVRAWEEKATESVESNRSRYAFINHVVPPALYSTSVKPSMVEFSTLISFDANGSEVEQPFPNEESWPVFVSALQQPAESASRIVGRESGEPVQPPPPPKAATARRSRRPAKRKLPGDNDGGEDNNAPAPQPKRRRAGGIKAGTIGGGRQMLGATNGTSTKQSRGVQYLRAMPEETVYRIAVSVIVIRTLAGGIDSYIDWPLVMTLFPDLEEDFLRDRWKTLLRHYRRDIKGLTENLQWKYLEALEAGEVPSVNFQDLKATDWQGIVEWALRNLDKFNSKQIDELPETRDELLKTHTLEFNEHKHFYQLLTYNANITNPFKEEVTRSIVFGTDPFFPAHQTTVSAPSLHHVSQYELENSDPKLRRARSYVLATALTPESTFDPTVAHARLSTLGSTTMERDALLTRALDMLLDEKLLQRAHRPSEGDSSVRGWEGSRKLYERFEERKMITVHMLRRAIKYKLGVMDAAFETGGNVIVEKESVVGDGDMVAILNLMAAGQIKPKPGTDVPQTRYGLDHERIGYRTRNMDKKLLNFSIELAPTEAYVFGDPKYEQRQQISIPRGHADDPEGAIPPWIDIQGNLQPTLWDMFLVGIIGLVAQLPGVTAVEISRALGFALDHTEVELVLEWCLQAGFAKMDVKSKGYETTQDWWWCISAGPDQDGI